MTENCIKYRFEPNNILAEPSLGKCLTFPLWNTIKQMLYFQSLPLLVCLSPQYRSLPSRFPSQTLYKERDVPFPKPSVTPYVAFRVPSKEALPPGSLCRAPTEVDTLFPEPSYVYLSNFVVNKPPPPGSQRSLYGERWPLSEPSFTCPSASPVKQFSHQVPVP